MHEIEQAADAVERELADLRAKLDEARGAWEIEAATVKRLAERHERHLVLGAEVRARAEKAEAERDAARAKLDEAEELIDAQAKDHASNNIRYAEMAARVSQLEGVAMSGQGEQIRLAAELLQAKIALSNAIEERDAARDAALEEAAKLVEENGYTTGEGGERRLEPVTPILRGMDQHHATIAAAIRALKGESHE